ncbi:hypothetical protein M0638_15435 [Roseomonas sp. NAR14]|uniref:Uncharacterized protein n=1 Tax=Roseomonas acroporae TaxID=2937791 RepID=A0A9X2BW90_9PROT|nr:hypothetical protein [Roseomonas acroporae]MCK8785771.1 hypothetical protein [Roseomonas acroporae]
MTLDAFRRATTASAPPAGLPPPLLALWWDARGAWESAHALVQSEDGVEAARVHAYLHRREGDLADADHWYRRAGQGRPGATLAEEWTALAESCLSSGLPPDACPG